jgi:hypothetical protein
LYLGPILTHVDLLAFIDISRFANSSSAIRIILCK